MLKAAIYNRNCKVLLFCYVIYAGSAMIFGPKMRLISLLTVFVVVGAEEEEELRKNFLEDDRHRLDYSYRPFFLILMQIIIINTHIKIVIMPFILPLWLRI